ncbi:hypothetical protein BYT27DRAFT_7222307 [Phlegmacium glaucopus]|nr:hypothetical protein BYT27DRAFT_7222307 [Phlegmacium glaucopus]
MLSGCLRLPQDALRLPQDALRLPQKICSVLCVYRFFKVVSLQAQHISRVPASFPTPCMFLPGPPSAKDELHAFSHLQDWPRLATTFQKLVKEVTNGSLQLRKFSNPIFSLMQMAAKNNAATKYLTIKENFVLAAIHVAAMKDIPFAEGTLPDLSANMPFVPRGGGFQDEASYEHFVIEYDKFIENCQIEGCNSSAAHVGSRSLLQLALMISPLYLLVTLQLSEKSFHRRTLIDLAARLGPHKPPRILVVENIIWDAIFCLAEGRVSVYVVLRDLANSLPWSDIDIALNCDADKQWFVPAFHMSLSLSEETMQYTCTTSFPQLMSPPPFIGPSPPPSIESTSATLGQILSAWEYGTETSSIENDDGNSLANALSISLNTTFVGEPLANDAPQHTPSPLAPLNNFPDSDFHFNNNDSDTSSDTTESNHDEPDGVRPAGKDQNEGCHQDRHLAHNESDSTESDSDGHSTESDPYEMDGSSSSGNNSDKGSLTLKETAQASGTGDPKASNKRRRSSSPFPPKRPGFKENPIDVDSVALLFEPMVIREYVKKEEISLPLETNPPIKGNRSYTVFDVTGKPESFTPSFHWLTMIIERFDPVEKLAESNSLTPVQMQQELGKKNIIVTGWPLKEKISFDENGLRKVAGTRSRQISINNYSIKPSGRGCNPTVVSGHVRDIWVNRHPSGKILNALNLPLYSGNTEPTEYGSELHAWDVTCGHHHIDQLSSYPTEYMWWALVGHQNALTFVHINCEGLCTDIMVANGRKVWGFLCGRHSNPLSSIYFFLKDGFCLNKVLPLSEYDFEVVALRPGDRLLMMPGQPHFVFSYAHSICLGGHYYLTNHMQGMLQGLVHSFILHNFLTNTSHPTGVLLCRIILFFHMGLIENKIPDSDPAASHLPNVNNIDGLMNLLSACVLIILGNVLDFRTYCAPTQEENQKPDKNQQILIDHDINTIPVNEQFAICYSRGVALHLINWIRHFCVITGPGGENVRDLPSYFFVQIAQTLIKLDLRANCMLDMLMRQIKNVVEVDPHFSSLWSEQCSLPSDSLKLANQDEYSVKWCPDVQLEWSNLARDFFYDGVTAFDECFFNAQKNHQLFELLLVIPQLKKYAPPNQRPSKHTKIG